MPELPEVETIRRDLDPLVTGRRITAVDVDPGTLGLLAGGVPLHASGEAAMRSAVAERASAEERSRERFTRGSFRGEPKCRRTGSAVHDPERESWNPVKMPLLLAARQA